MAPKPDNIAANPAAARLLTSTITSGVVKQGDKARKWYPHPSYSSVFASVSPEKFRKRFMQVMREKYGSEGKGKSF